MITLRNTIIALILASGTAQAATVVQWTFDGATTPADESDSGVAPSAAAFIGTGIATGLHSNDASDWTTPVGNGTTDAFSANSWSVSDYFQFTFSSAGYGGLVLDFDQASSTNGPKNFKIQTSTGSTYTDLSGGTYTVLRNGVPNPLWNVSTNQSVYHFSFALPDGTAGVRLVVTDNVSETNATILPTGASRVDTVTVSGDAVPEPASFALQLLGLCGLYTATRQRTIR